MQAIYKKRIINLAIFNRKNQYLTPGVEKIFQISYDRGLNLPDTDQAILDRLAGKTWFVINKPVQYRCPNILLILLQPVKTMLYFCICFKVPTACHISSSAAVCAFLLGVSPLDLAIIEGNLLKRKCFPALSRSTRTD